MNVKKPIKTILDSNNDGETDCVSIITDSESSDDNILGELSQNQEVMNKYILKGKKQIRYSHSISHSTGGTFHAALCNKNLY